MGEHGAIEGNSRVHQMHLSKGARLFPYNNMYIREDESPEAEKNRRSAVPAVPENVKIRTGADIV